MKSIHLDKYKLLDGEITPQFVAKDNDGWNNQNVLCLKDQYYKQENLNMILKIS